MTPKLLPGLCLAFSLALSGGAGAEEAAKSEPAPAAAAVPEQTFCGDAPASVAELQKRYVGDGKVKLVDESEQYLTYADDPKNAQLMYNFTTPKNPAHPAAVCRKVVREGDQITVKLNAACEGENLACAKLKSDFNVLLARMQATVNEQIGAEKK